eukprot:UN13499
MVQIPPDGLIKVTKTKPTAQKLSKTQENTLRRAWKIDSMVELYSNKMKKWIKGKIISTVVDNEGEWLRIRYLQKNREKEIQRFSKCIRPIIKTSEISMEVRGEIGASKPLPLPSEAVLNVVSKKEKKGICKTSN